MKKILSSTMLLWLLVIAGCGVGFKRDCAACWNRFDGADFVVVEVKSFDGTPYRCWELFDVAISSERSSDGIYWQDRETGNLVHVAGSYDYVEVQDGNWAAACAEVNMTQEACAQVRALVYDPATGSYR